MPIVVASPLKVSVEQRAELERMSASTVRPHREVVQASALLLAADGVANNEIARSFSTTADTVRRWRAKFEAGGVQAVGKIAKGRGRKPTIAGKVVEAIVVETLKTVPNDGSTQWSTRTMGERHGVGKDTVARIWRGRKIRPWQVDTFKLSNDPNFEEKLVDVVGLYLNPPERAVVFSFDEKTQCQALDRTQPSLPMTPGRARTMTHDYKRNGTTDLFAALNIATGEVLHDGGPGHFTQSVGKQLRTGCRAAVDQADHGQGDLVFVRHTQVCHIAALILALGNQTGGHAVICGNKGSVQVFAAVIAQVKNQRGSPLVGQAVDSIAEFHRRA